MPIGSIDGARPMFSNHPPTVPRGLNTVARRRLLPQAYGLPGGEVYPFTTQVQDRTRTRGQQFVVERPIVVLGYCYEVSTAGGAGQIVSVGLYQLNPQGDIFTKYVTFPGTPTDPGSVPTLYEVTVPPTYVCAGVHAVMWGFTTQGAADATFRCGRFGTDSSMVWAQSDTTIRSLLTTTAAPLPTRYPLGGSGDTSPFACPIMLTWEEA